MRSEPPRHGAFPACGLPGVVHLAGPALRAGYPEGGAPHGWQLLQLHGHEAINHGFDYEVLLQRRRPLPGPASPCPDAGPASCPDPGPDPCPDAYPQAHAMLGRELQIWLPSCAPESAAAAGPGGRCIAGIVTQLDQPGHEEAAPARRATAGPGASTPQGPMLRLRLQPWTRLADMRVASRVHQDRSVVEVLRELLGRYEHAWELRLQGHYPRLDYLVQFDETDGEFLRRQCARWGLHAHFEHGAQGHCLVLGDGAHALRDPPVESSAVLELRSHARPEEAGVLQALCTEDAQGVATWISGAHPECHPGASRVWRDDSGAEADAAHTLIRWHGADGVCRPRRELDAQPEQQGDALAEPRLNRRHAQQGRRGLHRVLGSGTLSGLAAGCRLRLRSASGNAEERHYVQRSSLCWQAPAAAQPARPPAVQVEFEARPVDDEVCPMPPVRGSRALGAQTATVLEAARSESSFTDAVGRLRVRLHWAHGDTDASTCWIRLLRPAAGEAMGCATWPRPGEEVLVEFLDGDPDAPVCLGLLRNPANAPQWPLPSTAAISGWRTHALREHAQDCADEDGNRLLLDDREGALQAQLASDSEASALRLGQHAPVSRRGGRGSPRGEGFELRSDAGVAVRAARALLVLSGAASRAAQDIVQPLRVCRRQLLKWLDRHAGLRPPRDARDAMPEGPAAALRADLDTGSTPLLLQAQAGLHLSSPRDAQVDARAQLACSAEQDLLAGCGDAMLLHADGAALLAGARQGLQCVVSEGPLSLLAPQAQLQLHARSLLRMGSARQGVRLQGAGSLVLQAAGQSLQLGPEGLRHHSGGSWQLRVAGRQWGAAPRPERAS